MNLHKLSDTTKVIPIFMADATTPTVGKTGLTLSVTLSKNGGAFTAAAGTVSELTGGHYYLAPTSADTGILGPLVVRVTATGAVDFAASYRIVAFDPYSAANLGIGALPASGTLAVKPAVTLASTDVSGNLPANALQWGGAAVGAMPISGNVTVGSYAAGQDPATLLLVNPANKIATDVANRVSANTVQLAGQAVTAASGVTFPASIGTSTYAGADTSGTTTLLGRLTTARSGYLDNLSGGAIALASQIPVNFTAATFASPGVFAASALANAPAGGAGGGGSDPWASLLPGNYAAGTAGAILGTNLDAKVSTRSTFAGGTVSAVASPVTVGTNNDKSGYSLAGNVTVGGYANGQDPATLVLDTAAANHNLPNSIGALINGFCNVTFAATGDPWTLPIPGNYAPGTAGAVLGGWADTVGKLMPANFSSLSIDSRSGGVTVVTNMDKSGYLLAPGGLDAVPVEANVNVRQALAPILAASAGVVSGAGTGTITIKGGNVTDTRIKAKTDAAGNRTAVTLTFPPALIVSPGNPLSTYFSGAYFPMVYFPVGKQTMPAG